MNTSLGQRGYSIIKEEHKPNIISEMRKELTVKPFVHKNYAGNNNPFPVYCESIRKLYLPRYFGIQKFGIPKNYKINHGEPINIPFAKELRENQKPIVEAFINSTNDEHGGGGIISIPCGYGKTVIGLNIASRLKVKTLIVVHKEFLLNQWKERIVEFVPSARIGKIQANVIKTQDKDIVIGMLQSISMKEYPPNTFDSFGLVIFDECHHLGAEVFSKALLKASCKYTLGLSATPKRDDGLTKVFEWYLGDIVYQIKKRETEEVLVKIIEYYSQEEKYCQEERNFKGLVNSAKMVNNICEYLPRTKIIVEELEPLINESRKVLVLSNRVQHLKDIQELVDKLNICTTGFYIGGMKEKDLQKSIEKDVILATFSMAEEGFDCKELDSIVLASPKSKIEQAIGRILRKKACDRDKVPIVIDIADEFSVFKNQNIKRRKFYKKNKYQIQNINKNPFKPIELDFID